MDNNTTTGNVKRTKLRTKSTSEKETTEPPPVTNLNGSKDGGQLEDVPEKTVETVNKNEELEEKVTHGRKRKAEDVKNEENVTEEAEEKSKSKGNLLKFYFTAFETHDLFSRHV